MRPQAQVPTSVQLDPEPLERATVQAVSPQHVDTSLSAWLLPMDPGTVGRARSAVPLRHRDVPLVDLAVIEARYLARACPAALRLPDLPAFEPWFRALSAADWQCQQPTLTQVADVADLLALPRGLDTHLLDQPGSDWIAMYQGEGLDPLDGASRSAALARAQGNRFACVVEDGQMLACGAASYSHGWLGVHGMRTAAAHRGRGLAARLLRVMAEAAQREGITRAFLQVDAQNAPAQALYRRAGFVTAWTYAYWRR